MSTCPTPIAIDQLLPSYSGFDAIGNHVTLIKELLKERGFSSDVYADEWTDSAPHPCTSFKQYPLDRPRDRIFIYHHSVASGIPKWLYTQPVFTVLSYHNITPYQYFHEPYDYETYIACSRGMSQLIYLRGVSDMTWSVSRYNQLELEDLSFSPPHLVFPVLRHYEHLSSHERNTELVARLKKRPTLLFVGRVAPHKAHIDMIFYLSVLKRDFVQDLRVAFVGSGNAQLVDRLEARAKRLGLSTCRGINEQLEDADVLFAGRVSDGELASFYEGAKLFLCLSEHEGFCVPLVEAMNFGLPIIAHGATGVPETLSNGGQLINKFNFEESVKTIGAFLQSNEAQSKWSQAARARGDSFSWEACTKAFDKALEETLRRYHRWRQGAAH